MNSFNPSEIATAFSITKYGYPSDKEHYVIQTYNKESEKANYFIGRDITTMKSCNIAFIGSTTVCYVNDIKCNCRQIYKQDFPENLLFKKPRHL